MAYSFALNTVYNHYLQTYSHIRPSRYDAHNKSELRSVYQSILDISRKSPLFLIEESKETLSSAVSLKESAIELKNSITALGGLHEGEILGRKAAFSSDPATVGVAYVGDGSKPGAAAEFEIYVNRLATAQVNAGKALPADETPGLPLGAYSFDVTVAGSSYEFQFSVNEGESNRDVQDRLARLFGNADLGLTAAVSEDGEGQSTLSLRSNNTGLPAMREYRFHVGDENSSMSGGAVEYFGLGEVTQEAGNAEFTLNGDARTAHANRFTIEKTYEVTLLAASGAGDPPVTIGQKTDVESISDNINSLIDSYNEFVLNTSELQDDRFQNRQLLGDMRRLALQYQYDMADLGVFVGDDGRLIATNNGLIRTAIELEDEVQVENTTAHSGLSALKAFAGDVMRKANQIAIKPMEYVSKKIVAYKNPGRSFSSPYITSIYSGMMFNSFC
jgi:flagellar hook-associated protein 2